MVRYLIAIGVVALLPLPVSGAPAKASSPTTNSDTMEIPDSAKERRNPVPPSAASLRSGKALWRTHCLTCHGVLGKGDGPNARLHEKRKSVAPRDLTDSDLQENLTDGELFWRITNGIVDGDNIIMPAYANKIPTEVQRWQLVHFVRQLKPGASVPR